jgi:predicted nucleotidyltransferase
MPQPDLKQVHECLTRWSEEVRAVGATSVYLFGSLIKKNGDQFNEDSDVDLVVVMPLDGDFSERSRWIENLALLKDNIEVRLMKILRRKGDKPIVSVVAITQGEISCDIHKDGSRQFFSTNIFRNLENQIDSSGLPGVGTGHVDNFTRSCYECAQKFRNDFLSVSANGTPVLQPFVDSDPLPKKLMRTAAMAIQAGDAKNIEGTEYDVKEGLDAITSYLYLNRDNSPRLKELQDILSVRRAARGDRKAVEPNDQLFLAEMILDIAKLKLSPSVVAVNESTVSSSYAVESAPIPLKEPTQTELSTAHLPEPPPSNTLPGSTTEFFAERFARAFPGVRAIKWYDDREQIVERLLSLLRQPLSFVGGAPIWFWRGGNLHIEQFTKMDDVTFLMGVEELKISRIAAVPGTSYHRSFVYVRTDAGDPTGLYPERDDRRQKRIEEFGFESEEYGIFMNRHLLTRAEYDDGAKMIDGKIVDTAGSSVLRVRYVSPYNFLIAAQGSPINNPKFDFVLEDILNNALKSHEDRHIERLQGLVRKLPLRDFPFE